ncbi:MAG: DUF3372 domain-containing protein [Lysobacteraceae bacterium]|nr:MAG: DUF3372 domain-containing protein [Xanthomonadaceae bacterium]
MPSANGATPQSALSLSALSQSEPSSSPTALVAACTAPAEAHVLQAAADTSAVARAYWLDRTLIQWPTAPRATGHTADPASGRFRLYHSSKALLRAQAGKTVEGAEGVIELSQVKAELPTALAARFRFIGAGPRLALPAYAQARLPDLLRAQTLLVREDAHGRVIEATHLQSAAALDDVYAGAEDAMLGAFRYGRPERSEDFATRFALWAPTARAVAVCLFPNDHAGRVTAHAARRDDATGVWTLDLPGSRHGQVYAYLVDVYAPGVGVVRNRVTDPYSAGLLADSRRSVALDLAHPTTMPEGWAHAARPAALAAAVDMTIYELHVRDFSANDASVRPRWRGKYLAFTEPDSAGMRHLHALREAGVSDVHLLPVFDFATVPERDCVIPEIPRAAAHSDAQQAAIAPVAARDCFNWGYDPYHFNAPEGSYATDADDATARIREFRAMIMALHAAGLRVGMDVVYNHTSTSGQAPKSVLDRIVPGYYHRLNANGEVERSTCCANTATEHRMMAKLMIDSAALWTKHYRIDSFRFDLMGHQPRAAMERLQQAVDAAAGRRVELIGEGWNFGEVADGARFVQASQGALQGSGIATFSDRARDALRGGGCCDSGAALFANRGLLSGLDRAPNARDATPDHDDALRRAADLARVGLAGTLRDAQMIAADGARKRFSEIDYAGQPAGYVAEPGEVVNYVENHDNPTLFDILALKLPADTSADERARAQSLGVAFVAFSQGIAYYHAGIELLRSKSLDRNSFDSGDWFNRIDWSGQDNGFGGGLPPASDNGRDWALLEPVLSNDAIKPRPEQIAWMRAAFGDLLRIRRSSTLFRMREAREVHARLSFRNVGPKQNPRVIAAHIDGRGYPGAGFRDVLHAINVAPEAQTLVMPEEAGKPYLLHPVHRAPQAADQRAREARFASRDGRLTVPGRTAVVFVVE